MSIENLIKNITTWSVIYEFSFQFWGPGNNNVFIEKDNIHITDFGGFATPREAMEAALEYVIKQNNGRFKPPAEKVHHCQGCGARVAPGNDFCGECLCEDDSDY